MTPHPSDYFDNALSEHIWQRKYRAIQDGSPESSLRSTWQRVARAVASVEPTQRTNRATRFVEMLGGFRFLPAGRILASAGTDHEATLFNCFVMGAIEDSMDGIFERLRESALTMQRGGGIGCDYSTLRPAGARAVTSGRTASGPVSFMRLWDEMCATVLSTGNRRGAMMGVLRCDHPDIEKFIAAKQQPGTLTNFNLSVLISDHFMRAVSDDQDLELVFPASGTDDPRLAGTLQRPEYGVTSAPEVHASVSATELWQHIVDAAYDSAEPGVLFIDRINELNNLHYREYISATNPCGEVPLPGYGACDLGSINLAAHVEFPYTARASLNVEAIAALAGDATRFLDNVIDLSAFPIPAQAHEARATRRIGLGVTGLADALIMLGYRYDSDAGRDLARDVLTRIRDTAYDTSIALAREKGSFPCFEKDAFLSGAYASTLPVRIRDAIAEHGLRNSHLLAIAPAGSISILANNVSSGIEPVFALQMERLVSGAGDEATRHAVSDYAYSVWKQTAPRESQLPPEFVTAHETAPKDHLLMAATLQPIVDNSISKTVNVAEDISREDFRQIYRLAFELGLKGCTAFRANRTRGSVLSRLQGSEAVHCCAPERESD
jgi:ribonucleoside-diphosphate reductase alpha chain